MVLFSPKLIGDSHSAHRFLDDAVPVAYACTGFREWESWLGSIMCSLTDFILVLPGQSGPSFSFAVATHSRQVPGACKLVGGGGAAIGE